MTSSLSIVENGLVMWEHDEIVRRKSGSQPTSAPDQKEAKEFIGFVGEYEEISCV